MISVEETKSTPTINLQPNVIDGDELQELTKTVFAQMAKYVSRTYGPFGENTAYQEGGRILTTKDGWTVEQGIIYQKSVLASLVRKMIIDVSTAINAGAGDGTTTGLIAANEINNLIMEYKQEHHVHNKFLASAIQYCVEMICQALRASATKVTEDNMEDIIYRIACVSLDWDTEYAGFIRDIYKETGNTVIRIQDSGTESSFVEYRDGYDYPAKLLSEFKVNALGDKKYEMNNPAILIFSYTINSDMFEPLLAAATIINIKLGRELVVMAPNFEKDFRDAYNSICIQQTKRNQPLPSLVMVKYFAEYNIEREMLIDLSFLLGGTIISKEQNEAGEIIKEFNQTRKLPEPNRQAYKNTPDFNKAHEEWDRTVKGCADDFIEKMTDYIGICDGLTVDDKLLVVSGFGDIEGTGALEARMNAIQGEINKAKKDMTAKSMFTDEIKMKTIRLGKLRLKMGIIHVGGFGASNLKAKRDALDDAINACANAYTDGVVLGGGIAIPQAIDRLASRRLTDEWNPERDKGIDNELVDDILSIIRSGFFNTWNVMITNRYPEGVVDDISIEDYEGLQEVIDNRIDATLYDAEEKDEVPEANGAVSVVSALKSLLYDHNTCITEDIIEYSISKGKPWNLITKKLDDGIIHPVKVETEIIKGCLNLVLNTTTINQLLFASYEGATEELEGMREVK
jgi:chaperonin GroEL